MKRINKRLVKSDRVMWKRGQLLHGRVVGLASSHIILLVVGALCCLRFTEDASAEVFTDDLNTLDPYNETEVYEEIMTAVDYYNIKKAHLGTSLRMVEVELGNQTKTWDLQPTWGKLSRRNSDIKVFKSLPEEGTWRLIFDL